MWIEESGPVTPAMFERLAQINTCRSHQEKPVYEPFVTYTRRTLDGRKLPPIEQNLLQRVQCINCEATRTVVVKRVMK